MSSKQKEENSEEKNNNSNGYTFKILTIGEGGVGKTSILRRYVENKFSKHHLATIGIDYMLKTIKINNKEIKLKIWDTAGQERYRNITHHIYKGADGIILVYDVTNEVSFNQISDWMEQINANVSRDEVALVLIGNKCDLEERIVDEKKGEDLGESLRIKYFETSALSGQGINEAFEGLVKLILKNKSSSAYTSRNISIASNRPEDLIQKKAKRGCC